MEDKKEKNTTRVIVTIPIELDEKFRELSKKRGLTKSGMIAYAMSWFLDYNKSMDMMPKLINSMKELEILDSFIENKDK